MSSEPIARAAYDELADAFAARLDTKAHNAFYDRPAVFALLPPVSGKRVLDAGCGPGVYSELLADLGAEVVAIDVSPSVVASWALRDLDVAGSWKKRFNDGESPWLRGFG